MLLCSTAVLVQMATSESLTTCGENSELNAAVLSYGACEDDGLLRVYPERSRLLCFFSSLSALSCLIVASL